MRQTVIAAMVTRKSDWRHVVADYRLPSLASDRTIIRRVS